MKAAQSLDDLLTTNIFFLPSGLKLNADGKKQPPVILFLSGWPDVASSWDDYGRHFEKDYHVVKMAYPGMDDPLPNTWGYSWAEVGGMATVIEPENSRQQDTGALVLQQAYRKLRFHAKGGLGEIYVADDEELQRDVVLKFIRPKHRDRRDCREQFQLEAVYAAKDAHPDSQRVLVIGGGGYTFPRCVRTKLPTKIPNPRRLNLINKAASRHSYWGRTFV